MTRKEHRSQDSESSRLTLQALEQALARQMSLLKGGRLEAAHEHMPKIQEAFDALSGVQLSAEDLPQAQEIARLYLKVTLALEARKQEITAQLKKLQHGKGFIRAYGQADL